MYMHTWFSLVKKTSGTCPGLRVRNTTTGRKFRKNLRKNPAGGKPDQSNSPNYLFSKDLCTASRIPFTKDPASSEENFLASSTASFRITFGGVSVVRSS